MINIDGYLIIPDIKEILGPGSNAHLHPFPPVGQVDLQQ
jgi:hypothetical protein